MYLACGGKVCFSSAAMQNAGESGVYSLVCLVTPCCTPVINTALTAIFEKNNKTPNKLSKKTCTFPYVKVFFAMSETICF